MRATLETIEQIEKYLMNEMSSPDKMAFENEINSDPTLKSQVEMQQQLVEGIQRIGLKASAIRARRKFQIRKWSIRTAIAVGVMGAGLAAAYFISNSNAANEQNGSGDAVEEYDSQAQDIFLDEDDSLFLENNEALKQEFFEINQERDTVIESEEGIVVFVPANSFDTNNEDIDFLLQTALNPEDILAANLDTKTLDGDTLETGGMFYFDAFADGERVQLVNDLIVDIPANPEKTGMQLYEGVQDENGDLVWTNPEDLKRPLIPVEITELDFYPPGYENWMNNRGYENKEFKDSLYYSFAFDGDDILYNNLRQDKLDDFQPGSFSVANMMMMFPKLPQDTLGTQQLLGGGLPESKHKWSKEVIALGSNKYNVIVGCRKPYARSSSLGRWNLKKDISFSNRNNIKEISNFKSYEIGFSFDIEISGSVSTQLKIKHIFDNTAAGSPGQTFSTPHLKTMNLIFDYNASNLTDEAPQTGVDPASIKAIWNQKFNETNLATKEFEDRIPFIHGSCETKILELYINNLNMNISDVDLMAYEMGGGSKFKEFAALGQGKVDMSSAHAKMLNGYYKKKREAIQKAISQINSSYWDEQNELDAAYEKSKSESDKRNRDARKTAMQNEVDFNTNRVYEELGMKKDRRRNPRIQTMRTNVNNNLAQDVPDLNIQANTASQIIPTTPQRNIVRGRVSSLGWRNVDCLMGVSMSRQTVQIKGNGKQSKITYEKWEMKISNEADMDEVRVYNIPQEFNSYVKLRKGSKGYSYRLNQDLNYQTVALGWNSEGVYFHTETSRPGNVEVALEKVEGDDWKEKLKGLLPRINGIQSEIDFADLTQKDLNRKNTNKFKRSLRSKVEKVIFKCRIVEGHSEIDPIIVNDVEIIEANNNSVSNISTPIINDKNCDVPPSAPGSFSPNNDGKNDFFFVTFACEPYQFDITIRDTYTTAFHSTDPNFKWGSSNLFGKLMVKDIYTYTINYNDDARSLPGWDHTLKGRVRVIL